jgi:hypothetical protein
MKELIAAVVMVFMLGCWVGNMIKLFNCDFKEPYKEEFIHTLGLIAPISFITVWYDEK